MTAIHELTALQQGEAIRAGELSPGELANHYLDRIAAIDAGIGAFVTVTDELARKQAAAAEQEQLDARRHGDVLSVLHGVPVAVKDVTRIEDVRCTRGSRAFADDIADIDDHVVARMKAAGLVILGTTNTPEFALPCYTENELAEPTRNPWNPDYSPGGSSGGSAAAVAAGMTPLAHGTDAGGSVRIPASACGLVGLKPSRGRVSNGPIDHDITGLSVHGTLARNVGDAAALLRVLAGVMPGDTSAAPGAVDGRAAAPDEPLRIAVMPDPMVPGVETHPDCRAALDRTVRLLAAAGHDVEEMEMNPDDGVAAAFGTVWSVVASRVDVEPEDEQLLAPVTRYLRERGRGVTGPELHAALTLFHGVGQMVADLVLASYDVILTPTLATPPARIGAFTADPDQAVNFDRMSGFMPFTPLYNITGLPAITVPLHVNADDLPIGVMLGGRYGDEGTLVALAGQLATETDLHRRPTGVR